VTALVPSYHLKPHRRSRESNSQLVSPEWRVFSLEHGALPTKVILITCILGTRVFVARVARQTKTREYKDLDARFTANLGYSHHQKSVVLDAPRSKGSSVGDVDTRRIVAFVGGVDLTG